MEPMNEQGLTAAEVELLTMLAEEAAEVVQACTKALRHGLESTHPDGGPTNHEALSKEMADLGAVSLVMRNAMGVASYGPFDLLTALHRKRRYSHHQRQFEEAWRTAEAHCREMAGITDA